MNEREFYETVRGKLLYPHFIIALLLLSSKLKTVSKRNKEKLTPIKERLALYTRTKKSFWVRIRLILINDKYWNGERLVTAERYAELLENSIADLENKYKRLDELITILSKPEVCNFYEYHTDGSLEKGLEHIYESEMGQYIQKELFSYDELLNENFIVDTDGDLRNYSRLIYDFIYHGNHVYESGTRKDKFGAFIFYVPLIVIWIGMSALALGRGEKLKIFCGTIIFLCLLCAFHLEKKRLPKWWRKLNS